MLPIDGSNQMNSYIPPNNLEPKSKRVKQIPPGTNPYPNIRIQIPVHTIKKSPAYDNLSQFYTPHETKENSKGKHNN